jgi:Icc-related predicted phosphoesterase
MKIVCISDTHGHHRSLDIPDGDVLIHAGDLCMQGEINHILDFNEWIKTLPHKHKLVIAGNHDFLLEESPLEIAKDILCNTTYLKDESVTIDGVKFYGSPWQPWFGGWAFNLKRGKEIKKMWDLIPDDVDILITHGPPHKILDRYNIEYCGCEELRKVVNKINPKYHIFGHIHSTYGIEKNKDTTFINASSVNWKRKPVNKPIIIDYKGKK